MPTSTVKRVVLYRFDRRPLEGIVNPGAYLLADGVELITNLGVLQIVPYPDLKALCFASETGPEDLFSTHTLFERRPKVPGLWTRFTLRDGDVLDGILPHNLLEWPQPGYLISPPRANAQRQRVFLPRASVTATELRGVVGVSSAAPKINPKRAADQQIRMFDQ